MTLTGVTQAFFRRNDRGHALGLSLPFSRIVGGCSTVTIGYAYVVDFLGLGLAQRGEESASGWAENDVQLHW